MPKLDTTVREVVDTQGRTAPARNATSLCVDLLASARLARLSLSRLTECFALVKLRIGRKEKAGS